VKHHQALGNGFTLLEVMIALMIMAVLTLVSGQALRSGINNKVMVSGEIARDARLADTLRIMRSDISAAFHYQDIYCKMDNEAMQAPAQAQPNGQVPPPGGVVPPPNPLANNNGLKPGATPKPCPPDVTGFIGSADSIYFTSLSNVRTITDAQESDQAKIGYFLKGCQAFGAKNGGSKCLYRSLSPYLDEDIDKPGPETLLVENVEEFKLRYLGPDHEDYTDSWKTGKDGDDTTRDKFPYAVEITLTLHDKNNPKDRPATQTVLAPLAFENNIKKKTPEEQQADANAANAPVANPAGPQPAKPATPTTPTLPH
jgi:prepilin-type N-terminal cleavage/methylation domain-containing protein